MGKGDASDERRRRRQRQEMSGGQSPATLEQSNSTAYRNNYSSSNVSFESSAWTGQAAEYHHPYVIRDSEDIISSDTADLMSLAVPNTSHHHRQPPHQKTSLAMSAASGPLPYRPHHHQSYSNNSQFNNHHQQHSSSINDHHAYAYQGDTQTHASHQRFLSYFGMLVNSYFALPLLGISFVLSAISFAVIISAFIAIPQFGEGDTYSSSGCYSYVLKIIWVNVVGVLNVLLALPATSIASCRLHHENKKRVMTGFHKFCCFFVTFMSMFLIAMLIVTVVVTLQEVTTGTCFSEIDDSWKGMFIWICVGTVLFHIGAWFQMAFFDKFRSHYSGQLGLGAGGNRLSQPKSHPMLRSVTAIFSKRQSHVLKMQRQLYKATFTGDAETLAEVVEECKRVYGKGFASEFYHEAKFFIGKVAVSVHNPLHVACAKGDVACTSILLQSGMFDINHYDKLVPFFWSIENIYNLLMNNLPWITWINSKDTSSVDVYGVSSQLTQTLLTPLHVAVANDNLEVVSLLINSGADLNKFAKSTAYHVCVPPIFMVQSSDVADVLIKAGANHLCVPYNDPVVTIYELAFQQSKLALVRSLQYWGGDFALTPLHTAASANDVRKVTTLLDWGAIPDTLGENVNGFFARSPLHWAAIANATEAAKELIERGATINLKDTNGMTPLHWAAFHHHSNVLMLLLSSGADPSVRDARDRTTVSIAAEHEAVPEELIRSLVSAGADVNAKANGKIADTALHVALKRGHKATAIALLKNGADIVLTNAEGKRPLDCTQSTDIQFAVKKAAGTRDVMISYTHSHSEFATKVKESLEANKITVWIDKMNPSGIGGGAVWRDEVYNGIANAAVVLCILTEDYQESTWCMKELALAKQEGVPIVAISCDHGMVLTDELQVYLYTRQIIPFDKAITNTTIVGPKNVTYDYDNSIFNSQLGLLLDGLRDEIEKNRLIAERKHPPVLLSDDTASTSRNTFSDASSSVATTEEFGDNDDTNLTIVIAHGDFHMEFAKDLRAELESAGYKVYIDTSTFSMRERIRESKDAIKRCAAFVPILSDKSIKSEIMSDQLAFAEDKRKPILPIMYSEPAPFPDAFKYQLSTERFFHFSGKVGFKASFDTFEEFLASRVLLNDTENIPLLEEDRSIQFGRKFSTRSSSNEKTAVLQEPLPLLVNAPHAAPPVRKRRPSGYAMLEMKSMLRSRSINDNASDSSGSLVRGNSNGMDDSNNTTTTLRIDLT